MPLIRLTSENKRKVLEKYLAPYVAELRIGGYHLDDLFETCTPRVPMPYRVEDYAARVTFVYIHDDEFKGFSFLVLDKESKFIRSSVGHIEYVITQSARGQGYGRRILEFTLDEARKEGFSEVVLAIRDDNIASQRIVLSLGGVPLNEKATWTLEPTSLYAIQLAPATGPS